MGPETRCIYRIVCLGVTGRQCLQGQTVLSCCGKVCSPSSTCTVQVGPHSHSPSQLQQCCPALFCCKPSKSRLGISRPSTIGSLWKCVQQPEYETRVHHVLLPPEIYRLTVSTASMIKSPLDVLRGRRRVQPSAIVTPSFGASSGRSPH